MSKNRKLTKEQLAFKEKYIIGDIPLTRDGFNRNPEHRLDLMRYMNIQPPEMYGGKFIGFRWLNVTHHKQHLASKGAQTQSLLREEGTSTERKEAFSTVYKNRGWDHSYMPPIFAQPTNGNEFGDQYTGHARVGGARLNNEPYIPIAVYRFKDSQSPLIDFVVAATSDNGDHPPSKRSGMGDFKTHLIAILTSGELKDLPAYDPEDTEELEGYVRDILVRPPSSQGLGVERVYSNQGTITKIVRSAIKEWQTGCQPIILHDRAFWVAWAKTNVEGSTFVCNSTNTSYAWDLWIDKILKKMEGSEPVKVIFYTTKNNPAEQLKMMKRLSKILDRTWKDSVTLVNKFAYQGNAVTLTPAQLQERAPFKVIGAVPQFSNQHDINSNSVVPLDKYLKEDPPDSVDSPDYVGTEQLDMAI